LFTGNLAIATTNIQSSSDLLPVLERLLFR